MTSLMSDSGFDPETVAILASAFDSAWESLVKLQSPLAEPNEAEATRDRLARQIILSWQIGERSTERLVAIALSSLPSPEGPPQT